QSVAADTITGTRQLAGINSRLVRNLNGGSIAALGTISISDRAGTDFTADLSAAVSIDDILNTINDAAAAAGAGINAGLNATGNGLTITDTTGSTANALKIADSGGLNLDANVNESSVSSGNLQFRYVSEATRLSQLNNGQGVAPGRFTITDTAGNEATIDLRQGESTIGEVIDEINSKSTIAINARINDNGDGILLEDTNVGTPAFAITVEEAGSSTAADLGILGAAASPGAALDGSFETTINIAAAETIDGATLLSDLNGGAGVDVEATAPDFEIQTASDETFSVNLTGLTTVQQVIDAVSTATGGLVTASINADDDGLRLVDSSTGTATFSVTGVNGSDAAEDLGITATDSDSDGVIDGEPIVVTTTLQDLADRINSSDAGVLATIINDGSPNSPFRLSLTSETTGSAGAFLVEDNGLNLGINPLIEGEDAVVFFGSNDPARSVLITSSSNSLDTVIQGATIDLISATPDGAPPTTINISRDTAPIVENIQSFVDAFNSVIDIFDQFDTFDTETEERGLLLGDPTVSRARSGLFSLITRNFGDVEDQFTNLSQVGIRIGSGTRLEIDTERLNNAIATDVDAVENLFTFQSTTRDEDNALVVTGRGVASTFTELLDSLTDSVDGSFARRVDTIDNQIEANQRRIDNLTLSLDNRRAQLTSEFNALEVTLSRLQGQQDSIANLANLAAQTSGSG
ncbi:MAG: flagellar filament capping protein FliD, partial [Actinomycetota bacterium]